MGVVEGIGGIMGVVEGIGGIMEDILEDIPNGLVVSM